MKTGKDLLELAATRIGEDYVYGANVDLDDPDWHGPWDCAEFCTWVVKQVTGKTYGCLDNSDTDDPEPYTGGWKKDVRKGTVKQITVAKAVKTPGAILLRYREGGKHIVFSAGGWNTIEAKSAYYGVCRGRVGNLASWDYGILIPGVQYEGV
jgi:N-acetylmuramoyl-L-alanine amidase